MKNFLLNVALAVILARVIVAIGLIPAVATLMESRESRIARHAQMMREEQAKGGDCVWTNSLGAESGSFACTYPDNARKVIGDILARGHN